MSANLSLVHFQSYLEIEVVYERFSGMAEIIPPQYLPTRYHVRVRALTLSCIVSSKFQVTYYPPYLYLYLVGGKNKVNHGPYPSFR